MHGSSGSLHLQFNKNLMYFKQSIIQQAGGITSAMKLIVVCLAITKLFLFQKRSNYSNLLELSD